MQTSTSLFFFFSIPMLYQLMPNVAKEFLLVSFRVFSFFEQSWISRALFEDAGHLDCMCCSVTHST